MPVQNGRKIWRTAAIGGLSCFLLFVFVVLTYIVVLDVESHAFLNAIQEIKVGNTLDAHAIATTKQLGGIAYTVYPHKSPGDYIYLDPATFPDRQYANMFVAGPLEHCVTDNCTVSIPGPRLQSDYLYAFSARHPTILLPAFRWVFSQRRLHHLLPIAWFDPVMITIKKGIVQELDVQTRSLSVDGQTCRQAEIRIRIPEPGKPSWEVFSTSSHMTGNADCGTVRKLRANATTEATREQLADALNFNLHCLLPGGYCTECEMLPMVCKHYASSIRSGE